MRMEKRKQMYSKAILETEEVALIDRFIEEKKRTGELEMNVRFPAERMERPLKKTEEKGQRRLFKECMEK